MNWQWYFQQQNADASGSFQQAPTGPQQPQTAVQSPAITKHSNSVLRPVQNVKHKLSTTNNQVSFCQELF